MRILLLLALLLASAPAHAASGLLGRLALEGYDPVIYIDHNEAVKGFPRYIATSDFMVYNFRTPENMQIFLADRKKYTPQFGGNCAFQATKGRIIAGDPNIWAIWRGKLFFFRSKDSRDAWFLKPIHNLKAGQEAWAKYTDQPLPPEPVPEPATTLVPEEYDLPLDAPLPIISPRNQGENNAAKLRRKGHRVQP